MSGRSSKNPIPNLGHSILLYNIKAPEASPNQKKVHLAHKPLVPHGKCRDRSGNLWQVAESIGSSSESVVYSTGLKIERMRNTSPGIPITRVRISRPRAGDIIVLSVRPGIRSPCELLPNGTLFKNLHRSVLTHFNRVVHVVVSEKTLPTACNRVLQSIEGIENNR